MENTAVVAKMLGGFYYYPLNNENNIKFISALKDSDDIENSPFSGFISALENSDEESLREDFQLLFEGCDTMPAPPWGSVYLDREKVIFGDSTLRLRQFLSSHNMLLDTGMREPEDQFGLLLMALANVIEQTNDKVIVDDLLSNHLLPWAFHYLALAKEKSRTDVYRVLLTLTAQWLTDLQIAMDITAHDYRLY